MEQQEQQPQFERERSRESKEAKEAELSPEAKAAAAMERAEIIVKEVKNNKKQMQNIVLHMGQVQAAIKALRKQLSLDDTGDATSVVQDADTVARLKKQIATYKEEILDMQEDLHSAQLSELAETHKHLSPSEREELAKGRVVEMISLLEEG